MQLRGYRRTETVSSPSGSGGEGSRLQALRLNQQGPSGEPQGPCVVGVGVAGEWGGGQVAGVVACRWDPWLVMMRPAMNSIGGRPQEVSGVGGPCLPDSTELREGPGQPRPLEQGGLDFLCSARGAGVEGPGQSQGHQPGWGRRVIRPEAPWIWLALRWMERRESSFSLWTARNWVRRLEELSGPQSGPGLVLLFPESLASP